MDLGAQVRTRGGPDGACDEEERGERARMSTLGDEFNYLW